MGSYRRGPRQFFDESGTKPAISLTLGGRADSEQRGRLLFANREYNPLNCPRFLCMARAKANPQLVLRPQDLLVLMRLSLVANQQDAPGYAALAADLGLTASEVHAAVARAVAAQLATKDAVGRARVRLGPLRQFVQHGARYCFPVTRGSLTRGVPTGYAAAPLSNLIRASSIEPPPVWPDKDGTLRGEALYPLYPTVPQAARRLPALHELLSLFDAVRGGSPRERALALKILDERWGEAADKPDAP